MLGYSRSEDPVSGFSRHFFLSLDGDEQLLEDLLRQWGQGEPAEAETCVRRKDGGLVDLLLRIAPVDQDNPSAGSVVIAVDITARKRAIALQQAKDKADAANRAKSAFWRICPTKFARRSMRSSDFRQLLERDTALTSLQREQLDIVARNGEHLLTLINNVLDMSKIEANRVSLVVEPFDRDSAFRPISICCSVAAPRTTASRCTSKSTKP